MRGKKKGVDKAVKKTTITFAIDNDILEEIRKNAKREDQSINSKINSILKKYILYYQYTEIDQLVVFPGKTLKFIIENIEESKLNEEYKSIVLDLIPSLFVRRNIPLTLDNWIGYYFNSMALHNGAYRAFEYYKDEEGCICLVFQHNYGIKWSRIIENVFAVAIEKILNYHTSSTIFPSSVILKIKERDACSIIK